MSALQTPIHIGRSRTWSAFALVELLVVNFFVVSSFGGDWDQFFGAYKTGGFPNRKLSSFPEPGDTIAFGERTVA